MTIELAEEPITALPDYARVPIVFTVDRVLDVASRGDGSGGFEWSEPRLDLPYEKDYDAIAGEGPLEWARRFDLSNWALFTARLADRRVGGALVPRFSRGSRPGRGGTVAGSSRSKLRIPTCGPAGFMSGRDAICGRSIAPLILTFQRRSSYFGTRTYRADPADLHHLWSRRAVVVCTESPPPQFPNLARQ